MTEQSIGVLYAEDIDKVWPLLEIVSNSDLERFATLHPEIKRHIEEVPFAIADHTGKRLAIPEIEKPQDLLGVLANVQAIEWPASTRLYLFHGIFGRWEEFKKRLGLSHPHAMNQVPVAA